MLKRVSPALTIQNIPEGQGLGLGIQIDCPILKFSGLIFGLSSRMASTVLFICKAILNIVSPSLILQKRSVGQGGSCLFCMGITSFSNVLPIIEYADSLRVDNNQSINNHTFDLTGFLYAFRHLYYS